MAQGVLELKDSHAVDTQTEMSIQYFLDRFYMSRIRYSEKTLILFLDIIFLFSISTGLSSFVW